MTGSVTIPDDVKNKLCAKDRDCRKLREALYHEARSEPDEGAIAVAHVIVNRASHPSRWRDTVYGVITEPWQFSYLWDRSVDKGMKEKDQVERMGIIAYDVISGTIPSPVGNAVFYHTVGMKTYPSWSRKKKFVAQIAGHRFYELS